MSRLVLLFTLIGNCGHLYGQTDISSKNEWVSVPQSMTLQDSNINRFQRWNFHIQNTNIVQGDLGFPAKYSGPNSLNSTGEIQETVTLNLFAGARLWRGAE